MLQLSGQGLQGVDIAAPPALVPLLAHLQHLLNGRHPPVWTLERRGTPAPSPRIPPESGPFNLTPPFFQPNTPLLSTKHPSSHVTVPHASTGQLMTDAPSDACVPAQGIVD